MFITIVLAALALATVGYVYAFVGRRSGHMPDGPPTLPIIGNLHQIPMQRGYLKFAEWAKQYGGMYSIKLASQNAIVLTDRRLVKELMDKRSSVSSNRPPSLIVNTLIYEGDNLLVMQSSDPKWRASRKFIHQNLMASVVEQKQMGLINTEAVQMRDICIAPEDFLHHLKRFGQHHYYEHERCLAYGIRTPHAHVAHMVKIHRVVGNMTLLLQPGTLPPVDLFPFLRWVPESVFGNWKTRVRKTNIEINELYSEHLDMVLKRRKEEGSRDSYADRLIKEQEKQGWSRHQLYFMAGVMMEAGSDTTSAAISSFMNLIAKYPEFAKQAQKEIDAVVGEERSPVWEDFDKLPSVTAIIKETMRFRPIAPTAFPHALAEDVWLDGKLLPKNSTIIINVFGLHHDETRFANPDTFDPSHFAGKTALASEYAVSADYEERDHYAFGVGRGLCPGIHLAERSAFVAIAKILWAFDIRPGLDEKGNVVDIDITSETRYKDGLVVSPAPFPCDIRPRSEKIRETIMREFAVAERDVFTKFQNPEE